LQYLTCHSQSHFIYVVIVLEGRRRLQEKQRLAVTIFQEKKSKDDARKHAARKQAKEERMKHWIDKTANSALHIDQVQISDIQQRKLKEKHDLEMKLKRQAKLIDMSTDEHRFHLVSPERIASIEEPEEKLALQFKYLEIKASDTRREYKILNKLIAEEKSSIVQIFPKLSARFGNLEPQTDDQSSSVPSDFGYLRHPMPDRLEDSSLFKS
jgi:hypothetical protein